MRATFLSILTTLFAMPTAARAEQFWYALDGDAVPLLTQPARIAIRTEDADALTRLVGDGRAATIEPHALPGWHIITSLDPARAGDTRALIADALADPAIALATPVFEGTLGPGPLLLTDHILVGFRAGADRAAQDAAIDAVPGAAVVARDLAGIAGLARIRIDSRNALDALDAANLLAADPRIAFAEPDFIFTATHSADPDDPSLGDQWALRNTGQNGGTPGIDIRALDAFAIEPGDAGTVIVVLDVGVDSTHPDLSLAPGADFTTDPIPGDGSPVNTCDRHGTWVAGCISATVNNSLGIAGGAGACRVASARIGISNTPTCNLNWSGQLSWTVDALNWALAIEARVTNNSNAYNVSSTAIRNAYEALENAGIIHFASAGNDGSAGMTFPASIAAVQAVGALNRFGALSSFSNFGSGMSYTAPGEEILSTDRVGAEGNDPGDFAEVDGTSFSSPYAAAAAALVATLKPALSAFDLEAILDNSATDLGAPGFDTTFGHGLINAQSALQLAACFDSWSPTGVSGPSPRTNHALAHDAARSVTVLFGGLPGGSSIGDTWEHNGATWSQVVIPGPAARYGHAMAYDSARGVTVLHGGFVGAAGSAETWEYDGIAWTLVSTTGPSARFLHAMVYDAARGVTVLFGGRVGAANNDETWEWDGASWSQVPIAGPSARTYHAMAYDSARERTVLFGGSTGGTETWEYDGIAWTLIPVTGPASRERAALAFDTRTQTTVLFGGLSGATTLRDTWEWNGAAWRLRSLIGPVGRSRHAMVFRDGSADAFTFGGIDASSLRLGDAWTWKLPEPAILDDPDPVMVAPGAPAQFTVSADAIGLPAYQWRLGGIDLTDDANTTGTTTDTLTILAATGADAGVYTVVISDPCGSAVSAGASLTLTPSSCPGDINTDGDTNAADFVILAGNFGAAVAPNTSGDLNGDGIVNAADFVILAGDFGCGTP
jgi:hypothetical protein